MLQIISQTIDQIILCAIVDYGETEVLRAILKTTSTDMAAIEFLRATQKKEVIMMSHWKLEDGVFSRIEDIER